MVAESYGLPLRLDEHGDLSGNATVMTGVSSGGLTHFSESGVIERSSDVDQFNFNAAAGTPTSGTVPLTGALSAAGSTDPDGSIVAHDWTFGDGGSASGAQVSHVYTAAGSYSAQLRVTDNSGLSATKAVAITGNPVVAVLPMGVADIAMSSSVSGNNRWRARAGVRVLDSQGRAEVGATVSAR